MTDHSDDRERPSDRPGTRGTPLTRRRMLAISTAAGGAIIGSGQIAAQEHHENYDETIESHDGTEIATTVYRPGGASADDPVPMILHSHGWSGSRTSSDGAFDRELDRGFGVLSFDQRGHGDSGGDAWVQNPELEGRDVIAVLDYVEGLEWVARNDDGSDAVTAGNAAGNQERADPPVDAPGLGADDETDDHDEEDRGDPVVFAMGGSYGGGYQLVGALTETWLHGESRFDALAPEITWYNLSESLAPEGVVRSAWVCALYALGAGNVPRHIHEGFFYGSTTGQWPDGELPGAPDQDARFYRNGSSGFAETDLERGAYPGEEDFGDEFVAEEFQLDVPMLAGQGLTDNLFNLNQGWHNVERALTDGAREASALVGYNGGHALPNVLPPGRPFAVEAGTNEGACAADALGGEGDFGDLRLRYFEAVRDGTGDARDVVGAPYSLTTVDGSRCVQIDALDDRTTLASGVDLAVTQDGDGELAVDRVEGAAGTVATADGFPGEYDPGTAAELERAAADAAPAGASDDLAGSSDDPDGGATATPTGGGVPVHLELAEGPLTVAGVPELAAEVTTVGVEQRVFFALSVGESPATAQVVQNNMLPLREAEPVAGEERTIELPGVAVDVAEGESLYLTLSAVSDMSFGHGSTRTPGTVVLEDMTVDVPVVE